MNGLAAAGVVGFVALVILVFAGPESDPPAPYPLEPLHLDWRAKAAGVVAAVLIVGYVFLAALAGQS